MSTAQAPGDSAVELSHQRITDYARDISKVVRSAARHSVIGPPFAHHRSNARRYGDLSLNKIERENTFRQIIREAESRRTIILREYAKTQTKVTPDATAEEDAIITDAKAQLEELSRLKFPSDEYYQRIELKVARFMQKWKRRAARHVEDRRPPDQIRRACRAIRIAAAGDLERAIKRPRHSDDAISSARLHLRRRAEQGKPSVAMLLMGYTIHDRTGDFQLNRNPEIEFAGSLSRTSEFHTPVPMDDALGFALWRDFEASEKRVIEEIIANANDDDAIRDVDRPAAIAKAKAQLQEAQHAEEAANQLCELQGLLVFRPADWPVEVMLGIEPDTSPKPALAFPVEEPDFEGTRDE